MKRVLKKFNSHSRLDAGMTMIELMVTLSIMAIVAGTVLFKFSNFSDRISLENLTDDIALQIKGAQNMAISGLYPKLGASQVSPPAGWIPAYGVYFDTANPTHFIVFYDHNDNQLYDNPGGDACSSGASECINDITITSGESMSGLCDMVAGSCNPLSSGSISFIRPFPDSHVYGIATGGQSGIMAPLVGDLRLRIASTNNPIQNITITPLGQILISSDPLPNGTGGGGGGNNQSA